MKGRGQKSEVSGVICLAAVFRATLALGAATNSGREDELVKLLPPHAELPPTYWEQHGLLIVLAALLLAVLLGIVVWLLLRPKPAVLAPIEVHARQELQALRQRTEDGKTLSEISRVLRRYMAAAFELPLEEMTTTEFCRLLAGHEKIGPELAASVGEFLRRCDELKFAPSRAPAGNVGVQASACSEFPASAQDTLKRGLQPGAAVRALELLELGEKRRSQLRQLATATTGGPSVQRA